MNKPEDLSRRSVLHGMLGLTGLGVSAALGGCGLAGGEEADSESGAITGGAPLKRLAVIGGGIGGISTAYFCDSEWAVDLFEARSKLGGHCDSEEVSYKGQSLKVDLGAQFFNPDTHPIYSALLQDLGVYKPEDAASDDTLEAVGSLCIFSAGEFWPQFSSTYAVFTPFQAIDFAIYAQSARRMILDGTSWDLTLQDWITSLWVSSSFKENVLFPWIASLIGTSVANARRASARSILQTFALSFPENLFSPAKTFNSKIGFQGNAERVVAACTNLTVHTGAPVLRLDHDGTSWLVTTAEGQAGPYDAVVVNATPGLSKSFVGTLPWAGEITETLGAYDYFDTEITVHTDPLYVHPNRAFWSVYNALREAGECQGSAWLGPLHDKLADGSTIDVFKSWTQLRSAHPTEILAQRRYKHPLLTPATMAAGRRLKTFQGTRNLFFAGQFTTGFDLQESAVYSAMQVAKQLSPASPTVAALQARLVAQGKGSISYDL